MDWDDVRYVLAVAKGGLARRGREGAVGRSHHGRATRRGGRDLAGRNALRAHAERVRAHRRRRAAAGRDARGRRRRRRAGAQRPRSQEHHRRHGAGDGAGDLRLRLARASPRHVARRAPAPLGGARLDRCGARPRAPRGRAGRADVSYRPRQPGRTTRRRGEVRAVCGPRVSRAEAPAQRGRPARPPPAVDRGDDPREEGRGGGRPVARAVVPGRAPCPGVRRVDGPARSVSGRRGGGRAAALPRRRRPRPRPPPHARPTDRTHLAHPSTKTCARCPSCAPCWTSWLRPSPATPRRSTPP
jgi:hypothetical protein